MTCVYMMTSGYMPVDILFNGCEREGGEEKCGYRTVDARIMSTLKDPESAGRHRYQSHVSTAAAAGLRLAGLKEHL